MHYIVDGYNLLFFLSEEFPDLRSKREELIESLQTSLSELQSDITIVFDGDRDLREESGFQYFSPLLISFSPKELTADEYILEKIRTNPKEFTVVTMDKTLAKLSRELGANTQTIPSFLKWVQKKAKKKPEKETQKETQKNLERLQKIFEKKLKDQE